MYLIFNECLYVYKFIPLMFSLFLFGSKTPKIINLIAKL